MYRIELAPGEEALFRTIDELAKAIHSGVVGSHARIWHGATNKWLPIDFHPHYKIAKERPVAPAAKSVPAAAPATPAPHSIFAPPVAAVPQPAAAVIPAPVVPVAPAPPTPPPPAAVVTPAPAAVVATAPAVKAPAQSVRTRELMFIELDPEPAKAAPTPAQVSALLFPEPAPVETTTPKHIEALVAMASTMPTAPVEDAAEVLIDISRPPMIRFSRRTIGAAAAGLFVVAGIGGALMARRTPAAPAGSEIPVASTSLAATPTSSFEVAASTPLRTPAAAQPQRTAETAPAKAAADSSKPVLPAAPSLAGSKAQLAIAESSLRDVAGEAESELEAKLRASGLGNLFADSRLTPEQIASTRVAVAGAANFVRAYRARVGARESAEDRRNADALLADMSALLGTLGDNTGAYEVNGGGISFTDADLAREYGAVRRRLTGRLASASGSTVAATIVRVLGRSVPPESL